MKLISRDNLNRGKALIDYAFSNGETPQTFEPADLIGMCAAYIARGEPTNEIHDVMYDRLGSGLARDMERTFETFSHSEGRGLWSRLPEVQEAWFTHPKLRAYYGGKRLGIMSAIIRGRHNAPDLDEPF